ncbi:MAG: hypothetical protein RLY16_708, partial [Bacteroidota bacterium]
MKVATLPSLLFSICVLCFSGLSFACPTPGTYSIGPTGYYTTITQAIADLNSCTLSGAYILELQTNYSSASETFPLTIPEFAGASNVNTITL